MLWNYLALVDKNQTLLKAIVAASPVELPVSGVQLGSTPHPASGTKSRPQPRRRLHVHLARSYSA